MHKTSGSQDVLIHATVLTSIFARMNLWIQAESSNPAFLGYEELLNVCTSV